MNYSVNQNRQFYVAKKENKELLNVIKKGEKLTAELGDIALGEVKRKDAEEASQIYFKHFGPGGLTRTDLIDVDKICYANITPADALKTELKKAVISLDPNINGGIPIAGQDYIVRIVIHNYLAPGDTNWTVKHGAVHAYAGMDATKFYEKLAKSLEMNFSREVQPLLTFEADGNGVTVTEVEQPWNLGHMSQEPVNFEVIATTVRWQGDDVIWAKRDEETEKIELEGTGEYLLDGKKIADLEWFCMGERGDQYRDNVPGALRIPSKTMVDSEKEYDVLDIHYFFSDTGVNVQKSEKDITIVAEKDSGILDTLKEALKKYVEVTETPVED